MTERKNREVGACIIIDNKDRILILLRGSTDPWKPGWWDLPGGNVDRGETPIQGATREAREESGLEVHNLQKIDMKPMGRVLKYFFATRDFDGSVTLEPNPSSGIIEHDAYKWVTVEEMQNLQKSLIPINIIRAAIRSV